jgi:hypothetical protein
MCGCYGDPVVLGVFSSVKKVTEAREWLIENDTWCRANPKGLYFDVFELNGERIEEKQKNDCKGN